jgi:hypothetical protein
MDQFVEILRTAHVLTRRQLDELDALAQTCGGSQELLRELRQRDWLTAYQADEFLQGRGPYLRVGPYILNLDLGGCSLLTDEGLTHLAGLTALESLMLSRCERVTDQGLKCLSGLTGLKILSLNGCKRLTDSGLASLHGLAALQSLYLVGCEGLTDIGLKRLQASLPRCKVFVI